MLAKNWNIRAATKPSASASRSSTPRRADTLPLLHDVLIPGIIGLFLVASPRRFTKTRGEMFEKSKRKLKTIGVVVVGVALVYLILRLVKA